MRSLFLATKNVKKVREMRELLAHLRHIEILSASDFTEIAEPEETGATFMENALLKASYYAEHVGLLSLADDSGLVVDALGGRPGVLSARYGPDDTARNSRLLAELRDVPPSQRSARFVCAMALRGGNGPGAETEGTLEGQIAFERRGANGFGYDPIFIVAGGNRHLAELPQEEKNSISHRGKALRLMLPHIERLLKT